MSDSFEFISCKVSTGIGTIRGVEFKSSHTAILKVRIGDNEDSVVCDGRVLLDTLEAVYRKALVSFPQIAKYKIYGSRGAPRGDCTERFYVTFINPDDGVGGKNDWATFEGWGGDDVRNMLEALTKGFQWVIRK